MNPRPVAVAAIDLGATSGRVMLGRVGADTLELEQVARFANGPVAAAAAVSEGAAVSEAAEAAAAAAVSEAAASFDSAPASDPVAASGPVAVSDPMTAATDLHWNFDRLLNGALDGLAAAGRLAHIESIGVDAWAVDYGRIGQGRLLEAPFHYRDARTARGVDAVHSAVGFDRLSRENGLQFLPFNTVYQLAVDRDDGRLDDVKTILLIPDLVAYELTGRRVAESTNASTTGLLRLDGGGWNDALIAELNLPRRIFPELVSPGERIGTLRSDVAERIGFDAPVTAVGSHDTASAVVGVPMTGPNAAYISCGTWGLVGVELEHPVISDAARAANFTNEGGVDGRVRFLRNVMGLWMLSECLRDWEASGLHLDLPRLLAEAAALDGPVAIFDVDDPRFQPPGAMPARIAAHCAEHGLPVPHAPATFARAIMESLAEAFAHTVREAAELSGTRVEVIHIVGGGSRNELLCRLTAERSGLPVLAGPVEATAIGNVLIQARAIGAIDGSLESLRALVARTHPPRRYPA